MNIVKFHCEMWKTPHNNIQVRFVRSNSLQTRVSNQKVYCISLKSNFLVLWGVGQSGRDNFTAAHMHAQCLSLRELAVTIQSLTINQANDRLAAYDQDSLVFTSQNSSARDNHVPHFCLQITVTAHKAAADSRMSTQTAPGMMWEAGMVSGRILFHLQCRAHTNFLGKQRKQRIKAF